MINKFEKFITERIESEIMSWKTFESYYMIESNVPKHSASYKTHMGNSIPLTPTITKLIFEGKKSVAFHISDIYHNKDLMALEGTKKPISCFTYYKDMETTKITPHTKGGVVYLLEGDLLFSYNKDAMSSPDESGRRWVSTDNFPHKFQDELSEWRKKNPYWTNREGDTVKLVVPGENPDVGLEVGYSFIKKYIHFIEELVKKHVEDIRRFCNLYYNDSDSKEYDYNEIVLSNVKVKEVLLNKDVILGKMYSEPELSANDFNYTYDSTTNKVVKTLKNKEKNDIEPINDIGLNQIIDGFKKKSIKVVIAENKDDVLKWFHQNGGITDRNEFIKGKERYGDKFW